VMLSDSGNLHRIRRTNCRMSYEPPQPGRQHVIRPSAVFHIKPDLSQKR